jgi:TolB-like protein/class 3 adenylate cyclase
MQRKLAAILAADVVGYSALMERDEAGTYDRLRAGRKELFEPEIEKHHGAIFKLMGDGLLAEFGSVVSAVECAVSIQRGLAERNASVAEAERIQVRIGINLGEVIVEGDDRFGEGVNVAARLEQLADPGGICVSRKVVREVGKKLAFGFQAMGDQQVKNIAEPVPAYRVVLDGSVPPRPQYVSLELPSKPSIAVMPFVNMSGDPEQEYFADGLTEDIITALSHYRSFFVIARDSSFAYKGPPIDVKRVGRELGVRYVLEGSVRRASDRVRISGQLVDAKMGVHLWADRFDGQVSDIFDLQDQVAASVVGAVAPKLEQAEIDRAKRKPTENLDAYDYFLRGMACVHRWTKDANELALQHFARAIELDPDFAAAYGLAARCYSQRKVSGWMGDFEREAAEAEHLAMRAAALGKDDALALCSAGMALAYVVCDLEGGAALVDRALVLNPNLAWAGLFSGWVNVWLGNPEVAIERLARAMRQSPLDPHFYNMQAANAAAHFFAGRYDEASAWAEAAARDQPNHMIAVCVVAASGALGGRIMEAHKAAARLRSLDPMLSTSNLDRLVPLKRPEDIARFADGLRKAGLPE